MTLPRSYHYSALRQKVSELNNRMCVNMFLLEQFGIDHLRALQAHGDSFMPELFPANRYAQSFNVIGDKANLQIVAFQQHVLASIFIYLHSAVDVYEQAIFAMLDQV